MMSFQLYFVYVVGVRRHIQCFHPSDRQLWIFFVNVKDRVEIIWKTCEIGR